MKSLLKHRCFKQVIGNLIVMITLFFVFYTKYCSLYDAAYTNLFWVLLFVLLIELVVIFIQIVKHD